MFGLFSRLAAVTPLQAERFFVAAFSINIPLLTERRIAEPAFILDCRSAE